MTRLKTGLLMVFGLPPLVIVLLIWHAMSTGESRMTGVCGRIAVGSTVPELKEFADKNGLSAPDAATGTVYLGEAWTYGRFGCRVALESGKVVSASVARSK